MNTADFWIEKLGLQKHPEGGYYKEIYRSKELIPSEALPLRYSDDRNFSTAIYFLLEGDSFSAFHRLQSDESWHFYQGSALTIYAISPDGTLHEYRLGSDFNAGRSFTCTIPAGWWFASLVNDPQGFALVGCTVAPGFDFADFELAGRQQLSDLYPQHEDLIVSLTRN